jgi:hypothetical protein
MMLPKPVCFKYKASMMVDFSTLCVIFLNNVIIVQLFESYAVSDASRLMMA